MFEGKQTICAILGGQNDGARSREEEDAKEAQCQSAEVTCLAVFRNKEKYHCVHVRILSSPYWTCIPVSLYWTALTEAATILPIE